MSKSTYFTGQPVYSLVIKLLDKAKIQQISQETLGSERYVKRLTGWKHLIIMLFGVLKHFDSLRELEIGMKAETMKLSHLGLDTWFVAVPLLKPISDVHKSSLPKFMPTSWSATLHF